MKIKETKKLTLNFTLSNSEALMFTKGGKHSFQVNKDSFMNSLEEFHDVEITFQIDPTQKAHFDWITSKEGETRLKKTRCFDVNEAQILGQGNIPEPSTPFIPDVDELSKAKERMRKLAEENKAETEAHARYIKMMHERKETERKHHERHPEIREKVNSPKKETTNRIKFKRFRQFFKKEIQ